MKTKVFSYLRVSGISQVSGDGFPRQRDCIKDFCKKNKLELCGEYKDSGVSGTKEGFDREGLSDMLIDLKSNGVRTFVVENATRLARDLMVQEVLLADCRKNGITVLTSEGVTLTDPSDEDPTRKLIRQVLGAVAEFEKSCLVQKLSASRKRIRKNSGKCEGRKNYGEKEGEDLLISRVRELCLEKKSYRKMEVILFEEGFRSRKGTKILAQQLHRIATKSKFSKFKSFEKRKLVA